MFLVLSWLGLAVIFVVFGKLCNNNVLLSIGAIMVLMVSMIGGVC